MVFQSHTSVELCNFVGILAWCRHFDRASPVEVEVAESEGKMLKLNLIDLRLVHGHVEVGREDAALGGIGWGQVEIENATNASAVVLDKLLVDDAATGWVNEAFAFLNEEALSDTFVHDHDRDGGRLGYLVVQVGDDLLQLRDLVLENLFAHRVADAITIDDEVGGLVALLHFKGGDGTSDERHHFILDDFLSLLLDNVVREVLAHVLVGGSSEADN